MHDHDCAILYQREILNIPRMAVGRQSHLWSLHFTFFPQIVVELVFVGKAYLIGGLVDIVVFALFIGSRIGAAEFGACIVDGAAVIGPQVAAVSGKFKQPVIVLINAHGNMLMH